MSPISIVSLATPLYTIHTELASLFKIYGNGLFLNVLFEYEEDKKDGRPSQQRDRVPLGFAKEQVAHVVETLYDKMFEFQKERIRLLQKYKKEIRGNLFNLIAFIILILLCIGGAAVYCLLKGIGKKGEKGKIEYIVWSLVLLVTLVIFMMLGISTFKFSSIKAKMKYNTDFGTIPSPLNTMIQNLFGKSITDDLAEENITMENTLLPYFYCQAKGCDPKQTELIIKDPKQIMDPFGKYNIHYMTLGLIGWILLRKNMLYDTNLWEFVRKETVFRFDAKEPYDKFSVWRIFSERFTTDNNFHPTRVLRAIQQLDPTYQSNVLRTSIKHIAEFMHRDNDKEQLNENVIVGKTLQDKFVDVLGVPLLYSSSFIVHRNSLSQAIIDNSITNRMDCLIKAIKTPEYVAAFFQDGKAYFYKTMPMFVYIAKKDDSVGCVIKATIGAKCFVGLGMYNATDLPDTIKASANVLQQSFAKEPSIDSFAVDKSDRESGTKYLVYSPNPGLKNVLDVWGIIRGASADMRNDINYKDYQNSTVAFVVLDSLKFVGEYASQINGDVGTYIDIGRKFYIRTCVSLFEDIDPNLSVKIDARFVSDLVDAFLMQPGGRARKAIEKDIMSILKDAQASVTRIVSSQKVSMKYIDLSRFSEKLMNLTERQFLTGLLQDYMDAYAAALGLNNLQRATDIRNHEIDYKESILLYVFIWLLVGVVLTCVALVLTFWDDYFAPKLSGNKIDWNTILDNTWSVIIFGLVLRAGLVLTYIWAYKIRVRITGEFDKKVCADKAAQVIKSSVDIYNCLFVNSISRGDTRIFSENSPKLNLSTENIINVYDKLEQNIYASPDRKIDVSEVNIKKLWIATINLLEGLEGCNDLLQGFNQPTPFPYFEISLWILVILVSIGVIIGLWFYMRPVRSLENIKLYRRIIAEGKTVNIDNSVPLSDKKTDTIIHYASYITLPIFTVVFCIMLISSTNTLGQSLYSNITPMIPVPP